MHKDAYKDMHKKIVLGIESSCDDTAAAVVGSDKNILSNIILSQIAEHTPFKGVVPEIAARSHIINIELVIKEALKQANISIKDIDCIAATGGPGLIGGVIISTMVGKAIASAISKPYIAINHLEAHALTPRLCFEIPYPYLLLLVSGGHSQFIYVEALGSYKILGSTLDDAVGEAFDKVAKMLGSGFPGGPIIEKYAKLGTPRFKLPRPILFDKTCNISLSGLKTAVLRIIENTPLDQRSKENFKYDIAASFQEAVGDVLTTKLKVAISKYPPLAPRNFVLAGGVASNSYIKYRLEEVCEKEGFKLYAPPPNLCTDNAAMVAWAGIERFMAGYKSDLTFCPKARWSLEELA